MANRNRVSQFTKILTWSLVFTTLYAPLAQAYECSMSSYGVRPTKCLFFIPSSAKVRGSAARDNAILNNSIELQIFDVNVPSNSPDGGFGNADGRIHFRVVEHNSTNHSNDNCVAYNAITHRCGMNADDYIDNQTHISGEYHTIHNQMMATLGLPTLLSVGVPATFLGTLKWISRADARVVAARTTAAAREAEAGVLAGTITPEIGRLTRFLAGEGHLGARAARLFDNGATRFLINLYRPSTSPFTKFGAYILWMATIPSVIWAGGHFRDWIITTFNFDRRKDFITDIQAALDHLNRDCPEGATQHDAPVVVGNSPDSVRALVEQPAGASTLALLGVSHAPGSPEANAAALRANQAASRGGSSCAKVASTDNLNLIRQRMVAFFRNRNEAYGVGTENHHGDIGFYRAAVTGSNPELLEISVGPAGTP